MIRLCILQKKKKKNVLSKVNVIFSCIKKNFSRNLSMSLRLRSLIHSCPQLAWLKTLSSPPPLLAISSPCAASQSAPTIVMFCYWLPPQCNQDAYLFCHNSPYFGFSPSYLFTGGKVQKDSQTDRYQNKITNIICLHTLAYPVVNSSFDTDNFLDQYC